MTSSVEGFVCQTCGDKGFTNAFVYCFKCLNAAIHRYCLNVIPKTLTEVVIWGCEGCKVKPSQSHKEEAANSGHVKTTHHKKKQKKEKNIDSLITGTEKVICEEHITNDRRSMLIAQYIPRKQRTNRKKIAKNVTQDSIKHSWNDVGLMERCLKNQKGVVYSSDDDQTNESHPSTTSSDHEKLNSDISFIEKDSYKSTNCEYQYQDETGISIPQSARFKNGVRRNCYGPAQPVRDPLWRGSFSVLGADDDQFEGFVGHLSNKACERVFQEANMLPSLLHLQMHTKSDLWPKSFQERAPSDDKIALYFFPGDPINEKAYDRLVLDMMDEGSAMKATTKNAELLIFTSIDLPSSFWRFKGKYYLWGVFRGKRSAPTSTTPGEPPIDIKKMLTRTKFLNALSPRSPLSNNGFFG